ncbi:MAG: hypothetical protein HQ566_03940 [Candidatus Omnitrophica bacterium]|nr:hypothetical protein [Candidatus Omnitrophota bacterium]
MRIIANVIIISFFIATTLYADTVVMKDRTEVKGLVVDEYTDRITFNTVDGEKTIFRDDIERVEYDTPEQNFMQLGRAYDEKGWYDKAAFYYKKAMEINPEYKDAREAYLASHTKAWRQEEKMTMKELEHRNMVMDWWKNRNKETVSPAKDKALLLKDTLGISLIKKDGIFTIDEVRPYSSAASSGIKDGDMLVGIWGKLIRYSRIEDVLEELLGPAHSEVRVLVDKEIVVAVEVNDKDTYKGLGILLGFEYEDLTVMDVVGGAKGDAAGFKKGDLVIAVDKNITRYLPLDSVIALINSSGDNKNIIFGVRRTVNLRREGK